MVKPKFITVKQRPLIIVEGLFIFNNKKISKNFDKKIFISCDIKKMIKNPKKIKALFHFGEFARIYQSFIQMHECINSNSIGTNAVFNFCLKNKIKLIY